MQAAEPSSRIIVTVLGRDRVGIIAAVANILADAQVNIVDISQTIMGEIFTMIMMVDVARATLPFDALQRRLHDKGEELGLRINAQREDVSRPSAWCRWRSSTSAPSPWASACTIAPIPSSPSPPRAPTTRSAAAPRGTPLRAVTFHCRNGSCAVQHRFSFRVYPVALSQKQPEGERIEPDHRSHRRRPGFAVPASVRPEGPAAVPARLPRRAAVPHPAACGQSPAGRGVDGARHRPAAVRAAAVANERRQQSRI
ncbi:MAG: ACT domain-containing protein [Sinobacteraceae bacterium]|nr:ACT domain-containing protein [Nevskiaceae bacterium]